MLLLIFIVPLVSDLQPIPENFKMETIRVTYPRKCEKCSKTYKSKQTYSRHKKSCGRSESINNETSKKSKAAVKISRKKKIEYPRKCETCTRSYKTKQSFTGHKKSCGSALNTDSLHTCSKCSITFSSYSALKKHLMSCVNDIPTSHLKCVFPDCQELFIRIHTLNKHLLLVHGIKNIKHLTFNSMSLFHQWMEYESVRTYTFFKKATGSHTLHTKKYRHYMCNFAYPTYTHENLTSRKNKKGSIPFTNCPVRIHVVEDRGLVNAYYYYNHNHKLEFENCKFHPLRKSVRNFIKHSFSMCVPIQKIQEMLQNGIGGSDIRDFSHRKEAFLSRKTISAYKRSLSTSKSLFSDSDVFSLVCYPDAAHRNSVSFHERNHEKGMKIPDDDVRQLTNCMWSVMSQTKKNVCYNIKRVHQKCPFDVCYFKCSEMSCESLCSHIYLCDCPNTDVLCKHVHKLHSYLTKGNTFVMHPLDELPHEEEVALHSDLSNSESRTSNATTTEKTVAVCKKLATEKAVAACEKLRTEKTVAACEKLTSELVNLIKHPEVQRTLLNNIHATLNSLVDECNSILKSSVNIEPLNQVLSVAGPQKLNVQPKSYNINQNSLFDECNNILKNNVNSETQSQVLNVASNQKLNAQPKSHQINKKRQTNQDADSVPDDPDWHDPAHEISDNNSVDFIADDDCRNVIASNIVCCNSNENQEWTQNCTTVSENSTENMEINDEDTECNSKPCTSSEINNDDILRPIVFVNNYSINLVELKSLDPYISRAEEEELKLHSFDFKRGWLSDVIINAYFSKILENRSDILFVDSTVAHCISEDASIELQFLHPLQSIKLLLIPLCSNSHWILIAVDTNKRTFFVYDSLNQDVTSEQIYILRKWREGINEHLKKPDLVWNIFAPPHALQSDTFSCGVFVCYYALQLINNEDLNEPVNLDEFRNIIYNTLMESCDSNPVEISVVIEH